MPTKTAAFALGATNGYFSHIMPPDRVFQKIASKTGFNKEMVKQAYLHKKAINWKALLTAGGLGLGGAMAIPALYRWATRAPAIGEEVQRDPAMDQVGRMAARNLQNSTYLQGIRGAFAPAESPWGKTGSLSKTSSEKISGFWGGLAGGIGGAFLGGPWGAMGGAAAGSAAGDAVSNWWNKPAAKPGAPAADDGTALAQEPSKRYQQIGGLASRNMQNSQYLQGIRGAFAPAPNPWGNSLQQ